MPLQGHQSVERESLSLTVSRPSDEQVEDAREAGEMPRQQDLPFVTDESVTNPFRWIRRLQTSDRRELSGRIAGASECVRRLARAQLPAVPDDFRSHVASRGVGCQPRRVRTAVWREGPLRIDRRIDRFSVMK